MKNKIISLFVIFCFAIILHAEDDFNFKDALLFCALNQVVEHYNQQRPDGEPLMHLFINSSFDFEKRVSISLTGISGRRAIDLIAQRGGALVVAKENYIFIFDRRGLLYSNDDFLPNLRIVTDEGE